MEKKSRDWRDSVIIGSFVGGAILIGLVVTKGSQISLLPNSNVSNQITSSNVTAAIAQPQPQPNLQSSTVERSQTVIAPISVQTKRVNFATGSIGATVRDSADANQLTRYVLWCGSSQRMSIKVAEGNINMTVIAPDDQPIGKGKTEWHGQLPQDGDYVVEIRGSDSSTYQFSVEVL